MSTDPFDMTDENEFGPYTEDEAAVAVMELEERRPPNLTDRLKHLPGQHDQQSHAGGHAHAEPPSAGPFVPSGEISAERAAREWGYWQEQSETRWAAELMLGHDHPIAQQTSADFQARSEVIDALNAVPERPDGVRWDRNGAQEATDRAYALLGGVRDAAPSKLPLFRGVSLYEGDPGSAELAALGPGDSFDIALASFSHDFETARSFSNPDAPQRVVFRLAPGAKGVPNTDAETEVSSPSGEWVRGYNDVIVGGRIVVDRVFIDAAAGNLKIINAHQVGVFDPDNDGEMVTT